MQQVLAPAAPVAAATSQPELAALLQLDPQLWHLQVQQVLGQQQAAGPQPQQALLAAAGPATDASSEWWVMPDVNSLL